MMVLPKGARSAAAAILLLTALALGMLFAPPALAGAATGMPSPFMPPYPDFGCCAPCPAGCRVATINGHPYAHPHLPVRAVKARK
jgi:hypothetical protein